MFSHHAVTSPVGTRWVRRPLPRPQARLRLFCFHPAGGGSAMYRPWPSLLPEDVEVLTVQLPGREVRITEPCLTDYQEAVGQAWTAVQPFLDRPYALFGHSMGALLAYGVAVAARRAGGPAPSRLLVSGCGGPGSDPAKAGRGVWSDARLVQELREMGGTPPEVFENPDLLAMVLPTLRADYRICESFTGLAGQVLDCPVSVLGGEEDTVRMEQLQRWSSATRAEVSLRMFPGGHFFLTGDSAGGVLAAVAADLAEISTPS